MRFVVLGATGMLGSELVAVAMKHDLDVLPISRNGETKFDASQEEFDSLAERVGLSSGDFLINAIGWIPQKASGDQEHDAREAVNLNTDLIHAISSSRRKRGFRWLQIGTDCVFSGAEGSYTEASPKDAIDLYGKSKVAGESYCSDALLVRCSIIGPDRNSSAGLYSWFKAALNAPTISGYTNHLWNGVTTHAFARLAVGLYKSGLESLNQHWVPADFVSKFELLKLFAEHLSLDADKIEPVLAQASINRTLATLNPDLNEGLWRMAGYDGVQRISGLVQEMIDQEARGGN